MKWMKVNQHAIRSECGKYTICRHCVMGVYRYHLWCAKQWLSVHDTAGEARRAAQ